MTALDGSRVRAALTGTAFADVRVVAETASTNDDAAVLLGDAAHAGATIVAEYQTAGRGRKPGRRWVAPARSALLFTTILPVPVATAALWAVPFWTALAVADGVEAGCGVRLDLRWPNDLDWSGRKVCGILCVSRVLGAVAHVGCGVGVNVGRPGVPPMLRQAQHDNDDVTLSLSKGAVNPAAAYLSDVAPHVAREDVLAGILGAMDALVDVLDRPADVARAWEERAGLRGRPYRMRLDADGSIIEGTALRLDPEGGLVLLVDGRERVVQLADARVIGEESE